jgi:DNA modification methylase
MSTKKKSTKRPPAKPVLSESVVETRQDAKLSNRRRNGSPAQSDRAELKLSKAKGRPMLNWVGKRALSRVTAFPAQHVESFSLPTTPSLRTEPDDNWSDWPKEYGHAGLLFHGDNKEVLAHLVGHGFRGTVDLIYIDPPFDSAADYVRKVTLRGPTGKAKIDGESYTLGEQLQYTDIWTNDNYLQFMYERLLLLRELLTPNGSIYVHSDSHRTHHLRCLMDEVFGAENFRNDIVWQRFNYRADGVKFGTVHDTILFYTKGSGYYFEKPYVSLKPSYIKTHFHPNKEGRLYRLDNLTAPAHGKTGKALRFGKDTISPPPGTMWRHKQEGIDELWANDLIEIAKEGGPQVIRYLDEIEGQAVHSIWTDVVSINSQSSERNDYPTQKPESLLARIILASSEPGDLVLDAFLGSGTTAAVAQEFGRRWIGCDINKGAIQTASKRLQILMREQVSELEQLAADGKQEELLGNETADDLSPAQMSFDLYRVNDYDTALRDAEAVNLACEHIGVERTRTDSFFDGRLGKALVKVIPLGRPLTPLDLEEIRKELDARPEEDRNITVVCLGMETSAQNWIDEWNRLRKARGAPNRIEVIELRTDPKYGMVVVHQPALARVRIARRKQNVVVEILDFVSPTILERLRQNAGLLTPQVTDWRAMVDSILIDTDYDGAVFRVTYSDTPMEKELLVSGKYELPISANKVTVAVKLVDMLGEEVLHSALI